MAITEVEKVAKLLLQQQLKLVTAESCTGGQVAYTCTTLPGSSAWFDRGFVTYSNAAKQDMLGVAPEIIQQHGAVSEQTVLAMVKGALQHNQGQVAVAITGIAGPTGGTTEKPVGTVWIAWAREGSGIEARRFQLAGNRQAVRDQATEAALAGICELL